MVLITAAEFLIVHVSLAHQSPAYLDEEYPSLIILRIINKDYRPPEVLLDVLFHPTETDDDGGFYFIKIYAGNQRSLTMTSGHRSPRRAIVKNTATWGMACWTSSAEYLYPVALVRHQEHEVLRMPILPMVSWHQ